MDPNYRRLIIASPVTLRGEKKGAWTEINHVCLVNVTLLQEKKVWKLVLSQLELQLLALVFPLFFKKKLIIRCQGQECLQNQSRDCKNT